MAAKGLPSPELLRKLLRYEPDTGRLFWRERPVGMFGDGAYSPERACAAWNAKFAGSEAFTSVSAQGYRQGWVAKCHTLGHRVAFAIHHGRWPQNKIDHINGDRLDNRAENLRDVSDSENSMNSAIPRNNTSGRVGVSWHKQTKRWHARVWRGQKSISLGLFKEFADACAARSAAEVQHGFHPNHGRRA